jgi:hypothetical protein
VAPADTPAERAAEAGLDDNGPPGGLLADTAEAAALFLVANPPWTIRARASCQTATALCFRVLGVVPIKASETLRMAETQLRRAVARLQVGA